MSDQPAPVRSYQRIFRPDRRIYQVEGHALPVPGGVPLRWLGYAVATLLAVIVISTRSTGLTLLAATATGLAGLLTAGRLAGMLAAGTTAVGIVVLGVVVGGLDWPLRLLVLPGLAATLATQATPDGRPAHRFLTSWLAVRVRGRRSLGRPLSPTGSGRVLAPRVWVAADEHAPGLRRGRVSGPATVRFRDPVLCWGGRWPRRRQLARPTGERRPRKREVVLDSIELTQDEVLELVP